MDSVPQRSCNGTEWSAPSYQPARASTLTRLPVIPCSSRDEVADPIIAGLLHCGALQAAKAGQV